MEEERERERKNVASLIFIYYYFFLFFFGSSRVSRPGDEQLGVTKEPIFGNFKN